jgi:DNA topoisomerase-3
VFEYGAVYVCEKAVGPERSCDFRSGKMILQQPVERAQMEKLLATGRTNLLTQFISRKGRRFKAFLVKTPEGKVGFEFEARAPRQVPRKAATAAVEPARTHAPARQPRSRGKTPARHQTRAASARKAPARRQKS